MTLGQEESEDMKKNETAAAARSARKDFPAPPSLPELPDLPDPAKLGKDQLLKLLDQLRILYDRVLSLEPEEDDTQAYDLWEERLEDLDDLTDDIQDLLDRM